MLLSQSARFGLKMGLSSRTKSTWSEIELERNEKDFSIVIRNFKLWKIPKLLISGFARGDIF